MTGKPMNTLSNPTPPPTAKRRGRPPGVTTALGHEFMSWPFGEWISWSAPDGPTAVSQANAIRNLAWRKGIRATVLTDRESDTVIHILKYEKGNNDGA